MNKQIIGILILLFVGIMLFASVKNTESNGSGLSRDFSFPLPSISLPSLKIPFVEQAVADKAWQTFQNYLTFAQNHDLPGLKTVSHQISAVCSDETRRTECFKLMDDVYTIGSTFKEQDFQKIWFDDRQIIMSTDSVDKILLYFTRTEQDEIKVLGIRFCYKEEYVDDVCVNEDEYKNDSDSDGWWDSIESLFY